MAARMNYFQATRHPWSSFLILLPLLLTYEGGVLWLGGTQPDTLRNGADTWMRFGLEAVGLPCAWLPPALLGIGFLFWSLLRTDDRPQDLTGVVCGMVIESVFYALGLWGLSRGLVPFLDSLGIQLSWPPVRTEAVSKVVTFLGAGIYEEVLFRMVGYCGLVGILRLAFVPLILAIPIAATASAVLFSAAHHIGPHGELFNSYEFLFRVMAGLYFAAVFQFRGFGIAAGAHALYDVVVG